MIADLLVTSGSSFAPAPTSTAGRLLPSYFPIHLTFFCCVLTFHHKILPGYIDGCVLLAFGTVQGEVFKHRIGAHFNSVFVVGNRV